MVIAGFQFAARDLSDSQVWVVTEKGRWPARVSQGQSQQ